ETMLMLTNRLQITKYCDTNVWINDRVNPRRPTDSTPQAIQLDNYLVKYLGNAYYKHKYE
ncbi:hypothetical protein, partial [Francisella tularensis]|uniref:hypothetical protein n=1 Tax=Francisella tularensis TaxID=263 RepID=UPI002381B9AD